VSADLEARLAAARARCVQPRRARLPLPTRWPPRHAGEHPDERAGRALRSYDPGAEDAHRAAEDAEAAWLAHRAAEEDRALTAWVSAWRST
jgi:hypothetical protein